MQLGRLTCGVIAALIAILAGVLATAIEARLVGEWYPRTFWVAFFATGGAVFALADWLGILSAPYAAQPIDLRRTDSAREDTQQIRAERVTNPESDEQPH